MGLVETNLVPAGETSRAMFGGKVCCRVRTASVRSALVVRFERGDGNWREVVAMADTSVKAPALIAGVWIHSKVRQVFDGVRHGDPAPCQFQSGLTLLPLRALRFAHDKGLTSKSLPAIRTKRKLWARPYSVLPGSGPQENNPTLYASLNVSQALVGRLLQIRDTTYASHIDDFILAPVLATDGVTTLSYHVRYGEIRRRERGDDPRHLGKPPDGENARGEVNIGPVSAGIG